MTVAACPMHSGGEQLVNFSEENVSSECVKKDAFIEFNEILSFFVLSPNGFICSRLMIQ